jgi:hypothetical protein
VKKTRNCRERKVRQVVSRKIYLPYAFLFTLEFETMYINQNVVPDIYIDGEEKVVTGDTAEGEESGVEETEKRIISNVKVEEAKRDNWGDLFGEMEKRLEGFEGMTVTMEEKTYTVEDETDDEYPNVKELKKKWHIFQDSNETLMKYWMEDLCKKYYKVDREEHPSFWRTDL